MRLRPGRNSGPVQAGIYCRLSLARFGDTTKVDDQARICRELCERLGWQVAQGIGYPQQDGVYTDNNKSAWKRGVKRPGWEAMLDDVEAGRLTGIVVYHGDRMVRRPQDLGKLLELAENKGIKLASPTGTYDLDREKMILWIQAAFAEAESDSTSRRKKAQYERMRRAGLVRSGGRGGRVFGFASDGVTQIPDEIAIVREVYSRVLAGEGIRALASALAARGVTTTAGKPMHPIAIRRMIAMPRYAGLMPDGEQAGAWEAVVSREDWEAAGAVMAAHSGPLPGGHNARRYLLSGIAICGVCESGMQALSAYTGQRGGQPFNVVATYGCVKPGCRKVYRSLALLDAYVTRRVVNRLANPANPSGGVLTGPGMAAEYRALSAQRAETEEQVKDYRASPGRVDLLMARLDSIDTRLAELRELASDDARFRVLTAHTGITAEEFAALPLATRRALVAACYRVTVLPASRRGPGFRTQDVQLSPR